MIQMGLAVITALTLLASGTGELLAQPRFTEEQSTLPDGSF